MDSLDNDHRSTFLRDLLVVTADLSTKDIFRHSRLVEEYAEDFSTIDANVYGKLNESDRESFLLWFLRRWGDIQRVPENQLRAYDEIARLAKSPEFTETEIAGKRYRRVNFLSQGYDFDLIQYSWVLGIHDIYYNQYEHGTVRCEPGDVIIDAGAFIGDTAVLFNYKTSGDCEVHCFELLDENLTLLRKNTHLNKIPADKLHVNRLALSDRSDEFVRIEQNPLQGATKVGAKAANTDENAIRTITIDDYVAEKQLRKVSFIKMDIEGAEVEALMGAQKTIREFKPKLAICLYHRRRDAVLIPKLINEIHPNYRFYFKWVHLRSGLEAVLLADARVPTEFESDSALQTSDSDDKLEKAFLHVLESYGEKYAQADGLWNAKIGRHRISDLPRKVARRVLTLLRK